MWKTSSKLRSQVSAILAIIPHLATKADVADVRAAVGQVRADVAAVETAIIKWIVATVLASAALAFTIAAISAVYPGSRRLPSKARVLAQFVARCLASDAMFSSVCYESL
jgi:hypothetical protein